MGRVGTVTSAILPGCEPFASAGGPLGVLVLHGFTGSPQSLRNLAEDLAGAGHTVRLPLLPGHGTSVEDLMTTDWSHWSAAALAAYDELAADVSAVVVAGLSMGGGLAALVAEQRAVAGCVFINPLVKPPDPAMLEGLDALLAEGIETIDGIGSDIKRPGPVEFAYPTTPLACAKSLFVGVADVYDHLVDIVAPSLLFTSREDHVVTADNGDDLLARVSGPVERIWLEDSYHVATMDNDAALIERRVRDFVNALVPS